MNINGAIDSFLATRSRGFSSADLQSIQVVIKALDLKDEFIVRKDYITDPGDVLHIHSTMLVASRPFPGSQNRGKWPYAIHTYFLPLSRWSGKK